MRRGRAGARAAPCGCGSARGTGGDGGGGGGGTRGGRARAGGRDEWAAERPPPGPRPPPPARIVCSAAAAPGRGPTSGAAQFPGRGARPPHGAVRAPSGPPALEAWTPDPRSSAPLREGRGASAAPRVPLARPNPLSGAAAACGGRFWPLLPGARPLTRAGRGPAARGDPQWARL